MGIHNPHHPCPSTTSTLKIQFSSFNPKVKLRNPTTARQHKVLEATFKQDKRLNAESRQRLLSETNLSLRTISVGAFLFASSPLLTFILCNRCGSRIGAVAAFLNYHTHTQLSYTDEQEKKSKPPGCLRLQKLPQIGPIPTELRRAVSSHPVHPLLIPRPLPSRL